MASGESPLRDKALFDKVIRTWRQRPDPMQALTLNQIASLVLGSGSAKNAGVIGRTLHDFREYFHPPEMNGYKWKVRWQRVAEDHSNLLDSTTQSPPVTATSSTALLKDMIKALEDEIRAVREETHQRPVTAFEAIFEAELGEGSFMYESPVELPGDSELPFPEGVTVRLEWPRSVCTLPVQAKLLSYDALKSSIIFEVEQPLTRPQEQHAFLVIPCIEELLKAVQARLTELASQTTALSWKLLIPKADPLPRQWNGTVATESLDDDQQVALQHAVTSDVSFLWGPPGTGKTYTVGHLIATLATNGHRVIAAAISNVAVDQIALSVVKALETTLAGRVLLERGCVWRFGHPRLQAVSGERRLFPNETRVQQIRKALHDARQRYREIPERDARTRALVQKEINDLSSQLRRLTKEVMDQARVVITTAVQTCIEPAIHDSEFDTAVIDEASMVPVPYVMCIGMLGKERFIIAGDFRQLGPIAISRTDSAYRWLHKDPFALVGIGGSEPSHPSLRMLTVQRRMHDEICVLINRSFYKGALRTATEEKKLRAAGFQPLAGRPRVMVEVLPEHGSEVVQTESGSRVNRKSAEISAKLAIQYVQNDATLIVGVITPYRAQVGYIKTLLREAHLPQPVIRRVMVGTIHAFQGSEADVIIWDLVDTRWHRVGKLYHSDAGDRLTNVAISRAQGKLVLIGDQETFFSAPGADMVGALKGILAAHFGRNSADVVSSSDI